MKLAILGLSGVLLLTGCGSSPKEESAESLIKRACETWKKDNTSALAQSLFVEASNLNENYRELAQANSALVTFAEMAKNLGTDNELLKPLAIKALNDVSILRSYCGK